MGEFLGNISEASDKFVKNKLPSRQYESTVGVYGGTISAIDGKMVYKIGGLANTLDVKGDALVRKFDDHVIQHPGQMLRRHPRWFLRFATGSEPMRHRGTPAEIAANVERLGLSDYYGPHPQGIEIKKPEVLTDGVAIKDVFRSDQISSPVLESIDRFQALEAATQYVRQVHDTAGPIGDFIDDIMFQKNEQGIVSDPVLNIPDVILTPSQQRMDLLKKALEKKSKKKIAKNTAGQSSDSIQLSQEDLDKTEKLAEEIVAREQKATDIVEFLIHTGFEESRRSHDIQSVQKAMDTIIHAYNDPEVLKVVRAFLKRGRPTLPGDKPGGIFSAVFAMHNSAHLGANKEDATLVRTTAIKELDAYFARDKENPAI